MKKDLKNYFSELDWKTKEEVPTKEGLIIAAFDSGDDQVKFEIFNIGDGGRIYSWYYEQVDDTRFYAFIDRSNHFKSGCLQWTYLPKIKRVETDWDCDIFFEDK